MNFPFTLLHSWLWVIPSFYALCCSPSPRSLCYTGSVLPGQGFMAHPAPMLTSFPCATHLPWPYVPHIPLHPPLLLTSSQHLLYVGSPGELSKSWCLRTTLRESDYTVPQVIQMWSQGWETLTFTWALLETWVPSAPSLFCVLLKHSFIEVKCDE